LGLQAGGLSPEDFEILLRAAGGAPGLLGSMAAELVERKVDLIIAVSPVAVRACQAATKSIPIVAGDLETDPVVSGFVSNIAKPGGNITGMFLDFPDFCKKLLQILQDAVPAISTVAVFWDPGTGAAQLEAVQSAARALELKLVVSEIRNERDVQPALQIAKDQHAA
jgi:putative tryptophan/tyrosine transport system substrate-binding protein